MTVKFILSSDAIQEVHKMSNVEFFTNSNFKVLSYLYKNKDANNQVKTTQEEIGQALNMNRTTINYIIKGLKEKGYIIHDESRVGRYYLTEEAITIVESFEKSKV